jgi:virulence factor Mce-like protein
MRTQIPKARLVTFLCACVAALGLFLYLNSTFGGPTLLPSDGKPYELKTTFQDAQNLVKKSLVMYRGTQVGEVDDVSVQHGAARVAFSVYPQYRPLPAGTIVQVDHRTFLQEPFVNVYPGPMNGPRLADGASVRSIPTVEPDDALQVFDPQTRKLLDQGTQSLARGLRAPNAGDEVNGTISGLDRVLGSIRSLATALHGQEGNISSLVSSSAVVLDAIGSQQDQLTHLIGSGRTVAATLAAQQGALGQGLDQLNALLASAETLLPRTRPLLARATPVLRHAAATARLLLPALVDLGPVVVDARAAGVKLDPSARAAVPAFINTIADERNLLPLAVALSPLVENVSPILGYVDAQLRGVEALIGNLADTLNHGDSQGPWLHGFLALPLSGVLGATAPCTSNLGLCSNAYPRPGDATDPQPYKPGQYPHLQPYFPG